MTREDEGRNRGIRGGYGCAYDGHGGKRRRGKWHLGKRSSIHILKFAYSTSTGISPNFFDGEIVGAACITHGHYYRILQYDTGTGLYPEPEPEPLTSTPKSCTLVMSHTLLCPKTAGHWQYPNPPLLSQAWNSYITTPGFRASSRQIIEDLRNLISDCVHHCIKL